MGGLGSGNRWRWNAKLKVEQCSRLTITELRQAILAARGYVSVNYEINGETVNHYLSFTWTPCHFGGERPWFICQHCGRRVGVLYIIGVDLACRHCAGLAYQSQNENKWRRAIRRANKIRLRLGDEGNNFLSIPPRPKGMHHTTYYRLTEEFYKAEEESWGFLEKLAKKLP
jgi:hypothetical protein